MPTAKMAEQDYHSDRELTSFDAFSAFNNAAKMACRRDNLRPMATSTLSE